MIDRYLEERSKDGEIIKHDSPLIRNLYNSLSVKHAAKPLSIGGLKSILKNALNLSRVRENFEFKGQVKMSRGFRKFYKSEADLSGMLPATVELTQGHSIGIPGHYLRPRESDILADYEKVIDRITIDDKHRLKKRNQELETGTAQDIALLKNEIAALKQFVFPGPRPNDKEMRKTYYKALKDYYKEVKGIDIDVPKQFLPDYSCDSG